MATDSNRLTLKELLARATPAQLQAGRLAYCSHLQACRRHGLDPDDPLRILREALEEAMRPELPEADAYSSPRDAYERRSYASHYHGGVD